MKVKDIIKRALYSRMINNRPFYSHEFDSLAKWAKDRYGKNHNTETYSRKFRELRESNEILVESFKHGRENGYKIISIT